MSACGDLLFLSHRIPYPPDKGDKIRAHAIIKHLAQTFTIHLGCYVDDPSDLQYRDVLRAQLGGECLFLPLGKAIGLRNALGSAARNQSLTQGYFDSPVMRQWIKELVRRKSITRALVFGSAMAPFVLDEPSLDASRCVLDLVDVDSDKWRQYARASTAPKRWLYEFEARMLARLERKAALAFGETVLVSPYEAATFAAMAPESADKIHSIGNGVDIAYFDPTLPFHSPFLIHEVSIVMTGRMDYWPNAQGAEWFATKILPRILKRMPHAKFYVVGGSPPRDFVARMRGLAVVTGHVSDIRPYLAHASVVVAPLRIARGVQNKVLEAMAMGRPVVATSAAIRALAVKPGEELLMENDPVLFAQAVIDALKDPEMRPLGLRGRDYVQRNHDWARLMAGFDVLFAKSGAEAANKTRVDIRSSSPADLAVQV